MIQIDNSAKKFKPAVFVVDNDHNVCYDNFGKMRYNDDGDNDSP